MSDNCSRGVASPLLDTDRLLCSRRQVLKVALGSFALGGLGGGLSACTLENSNADSIEVPSDLSPSGRPLSVMDPDSRLPIIWIEAGVCTGCAVSLLGSQTPTIESTLPQLRLEFQETLMDRSGSTVIDALLASGATLANQYLLIVDGTVPAGTTAKATTLGVGSDGLELTAQDLVTHLAQNALAVVALGTCASFGGIAAAAPNPANHRPLADFVAPEKPLVRIPGCPPHPGWILETLVTVLTSGLAGLSLDALNRPVSIFGSTVHDACPRRTAFEAGDFAEAPGDETRCLLAVGCKGPDTPADCSKRTWGGQGSCIQANHPCIGCAAPGFPDARSDLGENGRVSMSPIYT